MGGRGTYSVGNNVPYSYHTVDMIEGIKVLEKNEGANKLPEESHKSSAYILLDQSGVFHQYREYDNNHLVVFEIGYHVEKNIDKSGAKVLHAHDYLGGITERSKARVLTDEEIEKYKKYFKEVVIK